MFTTTSTINIIYWVTDPSFYKLSACRILYVVRLLLMLFVVDFLGNSSVRAGTYTMRTQRVRREMAMRLHIYNKNSNVKQIFVCGSGYFIGYLHHFIAFYRRWKVNFSSDSFCSFVRCSCVTLFLCFFVCIATGIVRKEIRYQTRTLGEFLISLDVHL